MYAQLFFGCLYTYKVKCVLKLLLMAFRNSARLMLWFWFSFKTFETISLKYRKHCQGLRQLVLSALPTFLSDSNNLTKC